nr:hypothetical protein [Tanacetum cinerariifolium]
MTSFDYRLNPLYPIKECSSCRALYTTNYCCSVGTLGDKIICDLDKTPNLSQRSPQNCPKCGHPVDGHYCQGCALLRKKFKEDLFTSGIEHGILQDSSEPSNDNLNVANAPREPFVVNQDPECIFCHQCTCKFCGNDAHYGYNYPSKVPIIPDLEPFNNKTIKDLLLTVQSFDPKADLVYDSPHVFNPPPQLPFYLCEFYENDARRKKGIEEEQAANARYWKIPAYYDDDDDDYAFGITPNEPVNSLNMGDEHLDTILATESDKFIKSSVENLVSNPSESEGENECDVPAYEAFTTFSNTLFDSDYDFYSSDDQSFSDEDFLKEIYSNPLFNEEIIPMNIDPHHFNAESVLIESMLNHNSLIISSSNIDYPFDEFAGELTLLKSISPGIDETDCDPEEETHFIKRLLYDNSSPRPSHIPVEDSDSLMEEIDLSFTLDYPMPPGIEDDDYEFERDILILEELLSNDSLSLPENESFHFDIPSFFRPPAKPPDANTKILNVKMMGDISEQKVPMPRLMITLVPNQEKSIDLLSHQGLEAFWPSAECPMMIHGKNTPILDVLLFYFYPLDQFKYGGIGSSSAT